MTRQPADVLMQVTTARRAVRHLRSAGIDPAPVLRAAGVAPDELERHEALLDIRRTCRVLHHAALASGDPSLGLTIARESSAREYGLIGLLFVHGATLRGALEVAEQYFNAFLAPVVRFRVTHTPEGTVVSCRWDLDVEGMPLLRQDALAAWYLQGRELTRTPWTPLAVGMQDIPEPQVAHDLFGVEVTLTPDRDELVLPPEVLDLSNPHADPVLLVHLREAAEVQIRRRRAAQGASPGSILRLEGSVVDLATGLVHRGDETLRLTPRELTLLAFFAAHPNELISHDRIEKEVWGLAGAVVTFAPAVAVRRLRRKIEPEDGKAVNLVTVFGEGWKLNLPGVD